MKSFDNDSIDSLQEGDGLVSVHLVVAAGTIKHLLIVWNIIQLFLNIIFFFNIK